MGRIFNELSIRKRVYFLYSTLLCILLLASVTVIYFYLLHLFEQESQNNQLKVCEQASAQVQMVIDDMDELALIVSMNPSVKSVLKSARSSEVEGNYFDIFPRYRNDIYEVLLSLTAFTPYKYRVSIYNVNEDYVSVGSPDESSVILERLTSPLLTDQLKEVSQLKGSAYLETSHPDKWSTDIDNKYVSVIREVRVLEQDAVSYGYVEVQVDYSVFEKICSVPEAGGLSMVIMDGAGHTLYPYGSPSVLATSELIKDAISQGRTSRIQRLYDEALGPLYLSVDYAKGNDLYFIGIQSVNAIKGAFRPVLNVLLLTIAAIGTITMILVYFITKNAFRPLKELTEFITDTSVENLQFEMHDNKDNHIKKLNEAFELMFGRINVYMNQVMTLRSLEMKAQYNALQAQMSPHFIFNMISVINASAQEIGADHIMDMCQKLSEMIRYVAHYEEATITIEEEIEHMENYLDLMHYRYEEKFTYSIQLAPEASSIKVPKMILQPFIENAFNHGFSKCPAPWHVELDVSWIDREWRVEISDNGPGMTDEAIRQQETRIMAAIKDDVGVSGMRIGGLSMINVAKRLWLQYGDSMLFAIRHGDEKGLKIVMGGREYD